MTARITTPGIYDLPAATYHADPVAAAPSLSSSIARLLLNRSPMHAWHCHPRLNVMQEPKTPTDAMEYGAILHRLFLNAGAEIVEVDADDWRSKEARNLRAEAREAGKLPVLAWKLAELERCAEAARDQIRAYPEIVAALAAGRPEQTLVWREGETWCRGLLDWLPDNPRAPLLDLKATGLNAAPDAWEKNLVAEYAVQAAFYARGAEAVRGHAPDGVRFIVIELDPPHLSHEHEGVGGILEMHEAELTRIAGQDLGKRERAKFSAWIKPKAEHNKLVNRLLQIRAHMILCFRAKDKLVLVRNENGKQEPVSVGWTPICADRLDYEMTTMLVLPPGSEGRPDFTAKSFKRNDDLAAIFHDGEQITEDHGAALRKWIAGSVEPSKSGADQSAKPKRTWSDVLADLRQLADAAESGSEVEALRGHDLLRMIMDKAAEPVRKEAERILRDAAERFVPGLDEEAA